MVRNFSELNSKLLTKTEKINLFFCTHHYLCSVLISLQFILATLHAIELLLHWITQKLYFPKTANSLNQYLI